MNILITGAGGAATPALVEVFKEKGRYNPILVDMNITTRIKSYDAISVQIPAANSKDFVPAIVDIVREYDIKAIVPGVDEELVSLAKYYSSSNTPYIVSPSEDIIKLTLDKYKLNKFLQKKGVIVPETWHIRDFDIIDENFIAKSLIAKPIFGRGSRGVYFSDSVEEARYLAKYLSLKQPNTIFQELIRGIEYTVSMVCSKSGEVLGIVPKRVVDKRGITIEAVTEKNPIIEAYCRQIQDALFATGPMNIQLMMSEEGIPYVFEINPRVSTTTILTIIAGFDEIDVAIRDHFDEEIGSLEWADGVRLYRAWNNYFTASNEKYIHVGKTIL